MQVGIHLPHIGRKAGPDTILRAAMQAEQLGLADVWVSEHIIVPKDGGLSSVTRTSRDPVLTLTWAKPRARNGCDWGHRCWCCRCGIRCRWRKNWRSDVTKPVERQADFGVLALAWLEAEFDALGVPFKRARTAYG